jgi:hypothetical protein
MNGRSTDSRGARKPSIALAPPLFHWTQTRLSLKSPIIWRAILSRENVSNDHQECRLFQQCSQRQTGRRAMKADARDLEPCAGSASSEIGSRSAWAFPPSTAITKPDRRRP